METKRLPSMFTLPEGQDFQDLIECIKDWALFHGAAMRSKTNFSSDSVNFAPFTLLPSSFPKKEFEKAANIQLILNELIHNVAHDYEFLRNVLKNTIQVDSFTKNLFDIYEIVHKEGIAQPISLGLLRSDYMIDSKNNHLIVKQVEVNTIASSLAGLSTQFNLMHRFVLERLHRFNDLEKLPENNALTGLCQGILDAWKLYENPRAAVLVLVEDITHNICDQRFHEFELYKLKPEITIIRKTLTELNTCGLLTDDKRFLVNGIEIAVVYFRSGYSPDQYHTKKEWDVRLMMERSKAIKCPSIQYHLAGTKKVQQALASERVLANFLNNPEQIKRVIDVFTGLYSLEMDREGDEAVEMAFNNPSNFVLKPQREGGGNNVYGDDICEVLSKIGNSSERTAYILMTRIQPPVLSNYIVRPNNVGDVVAQDVVSELGIYGVVIGNAKQLTVNRQVGHMLRTKGYLADEGGVAAGIGALDSPFLY